MTLTLQAGGAIKTEDRPAGDPARLCAFDRDVLGDLALGDIALEREVLSMFLDRSLALTRVIRDSDAKRARDVAAHTLKGAALAIGARQLAARAAQIEDLAPDAPQAELLAAMAALHASVAEARAAIAAALASGLLG